MYRIPLGLLFLTLACDQPAVVDGPGPANTSGAPDPADSGGQGGGGADTSDTDTDDDTAVADSGSSTGTDTATGDDGADSGGQDTGGGEPAPEMMANFSLDDLNPTSPRYGEVVSPRDYIEEVSGWYFIKGS